MEPCLYRYLDTNGECFILLYVDDALLSGTKKTVEHIQGEISKHFKCKFNSPKDFLGVNISTSTPGLTSLSMTAFTEKMMTSHEVPQWTYKITTPGRTDVKIVRGLNSVPNETYRSKVGSINWLVMALLTLRSIVYGQRTITRSY